MNERSGSENTIPCFCLKGGRVDLRLIAKCYNDGEV